MATASIPVKQLEDITECPICSETYVDPRVLPCVHTYCLRCIESLGRDKKPGDAIPCPLCRKEFAIPAGGISEFPKNFFMQQMMDMKSLSDILSHEDSLCDVCSDDDGDLSTKGRKSDRKAIVYCTDCRKNMCEQCSRCHQQFKQQPGTHKLIERSQSPMPADELLLKFPETSCDKHPDKSLEIYCLECKTVICYMCHIKGHNTHKCSDVKEVADELTTQMTSDAEGIEGKINNCKSMLKNVEEEERFLTDEVKNTEKAINEKADKLIQLIDQHRAGMIDKLFTAKTRQFKANETVKQELERQILLMENFVRYMEELKQKGTACDIVKMAGGLRARGEELLKFDVEEDLPVDYSSTSMKFEATLSDDDIKQVLGELDVTVDIKDYATDDFLKSPKLAYTIPLSNTGGSVVGIATLGEELFVVRWGIPNVQVYKPSANCVNVQRNINVGAGSNTFRGLAACELNQCLYVSEQNPQAIHKVLPVTNNTVKQWSVNGLPYGLSVNSAHNLLVACHNTHKVEEYTTDGTMVRDINLQPGITSPTHVVQLPSGNFGITHHGPVHGYSEVDGDGKIMKRVPATHAPAQMSSPQGFAVSKNGSRVFVADNGNNRILLLLNSESMSVQQLPDPLNAVLSAPYTIHFDVSTGTMYVGEWGGCRIMCYQKST